MSLRSRLDHQRKLASLAWVSCNLISIMHMKKPSHTGHLGNLIVVDLVNAGHEICVFCSNEEEKMTFKALAIEVMENPCDVFMSSSIIFTYLPNDAEIQKVKSFELIDPPTSFTFFISSLARLSSDHKASLKSLQNSSEERDTLK